MTNETHSHAAQSDWADALDLEATILAEQTSSLLSWLPLTAAPHRIVDLGCGTGVGTIALLDRFPTAHVTAVDASADLVGRLRDKVREVGSADRVTIVHADLDEALPSLGHPDLVWAAASLHHLADPVAVLRGVRDTLAPGGLVVVVEPDGLPRFLSDDAPGHRPGLERRCHEAVDRRTHAHMPHRGGDFGPLIDAAGLRVADSRVFAAAVEGTGSDAVTRYALLILRRLRHGLAEAIPADDLAALDQLLDPTSPHHLSRRDDLVMRVRRTVWAARAH